MGNTTGEWQEGGSGTLHVDGLATDSEEVCKPDHNPFTDTVCSCLADDGMVWSTMSNEDSDNGGFAFFYIMVDVIQEADEVV